jgi:hypothetical protein
MIHRELSIAIGKMLNLLLLGDDLLVKQIDLLGRYGFIGGLCLLAGGRGLSTNVV